MTTEIPEMGRAQMEGQSRAVSPAHVRQVFAEYARLFSASDVAGLGALFAADAQVRDPVTAPPVQGRDSICRWFQSAFDAIPSGMAMTLEGDVRVAGQHAAAALVVHAYNGGSAFRVDTLDVMRFDDDGLIASMDAYFGESNYHAE
ncbi:MAG TPA: nuclear transport factor 2 family protein [Nevskiaceae bacterium]|nr:nuclear transport factor 2 family protein [Nevskiaceae bacterium]